MTEPTRSLEVAIQTDETEMALDEVDALLLTAGLERMPNAAPSRILPCQDWAVYHYFACPKLIQRFETGDCRVDSLAAAMWRARMPIAWIREPGHVALWCDSAWEPEVQLIVDVQYATPVAAKPRPNERLRPVRDADFGASSRSHRVVLLVGPSFAPALERLVNAIRNPTPPYAIELVADPDSLKLLDKIGIPPSEALLAGTVDWDDEAWASYDQLGEDIEWNGGPSGALLRRTYAIGARELGYVRPGHDSPCSEIVRKLWLEQMPWGVELSMGEYAFVPGHLFAEARRLVDSPLWLGDEESPSPIRIGAVPPPIEVESLTGEGVELGGSRTKALLVFFFHRESPFVMAAFDVLLENLTEAQSSGFDVDLAVVCMERDFQETAANKLHGYTGEFEVYLPMDNDHLQFYRDGLGLPSALMLGANGNVRAIVPFDSVFQSFAYQISACLKSGS